MTSLLTRLFGVDSLHTLLEGLIPVLLFVVGLNLVFLIPMFFFDLYHKIKSKKEIARLSQQEIAPGITLKEGLEAYFDYDVHWGYFSGCVSVLAYGKPPDVQACFFVSSTTGEYDVPVFQDGTDHIELCHDVRRDAMLNHLIQAAREKRGELPS